MLIVKGGANRKDVGVTPFTTNPAFRHSRAISGAVRLSVIFVSSSAAKRSPEPRTLFIPLTFYVPFPKNIKPASVVIYRDLLQTKEKVQKISLK